MVEVHQASLVIALFCSLFCSNNTGFHCFQNIQSSSKLKNFALVVPSAFFFHSWLLSQLRSHIFKKRAFPDLLLLKHLPEHYSLSQHPINFPHSNPFSPKLSHLGKAPFVYCLGRLPKNTIILRMKTLSISVTASICAAEHILAHVKYLSNEQINFQINCDCLFQYTLR